MYPRVVLLTSSLLLAFITDALAGPRSTTIPPPPVAGPVASHGITVAPERNAIVPLDKRIGVTSTATPALRCTYTKRVPVPLYTATHNTAGDSAAATFTSYVNCRECNTVTAITVKYVPGRAGGPAWRQPLTAPTPTAATATTTIYSCLATPSNITVPRPGVISSLRTLPVESTVFES